MFTRGLLPQTQSNLETLSRLSFIHKYYLAGGTALSLHFGHRFSNDLDFFSQNPEDPFIIRSKLANAGRLEVLQNEKGTFNGIFNKIKLSFFVYTHPLLFPALKYKNIKVADIQDIACMKTDAISARGTKRDFIDLYHICRKTRRLQKILDLYLKKYSSAQFNKLHLLKSLVYFQDAENDPMPRMIEETSWKKVKQFFIEKTRGIII